MSGTDIGLLDRFNRWIARRVTSPLQGVTFGSWRRLLFRGGVRVHPEFVPRAVVAGVASVANSLVARVERSRFADRVEAARPHPPLFVLGHYRSGTTHLHNLLALDSRFAFPNYYQVSFPHTFLATEGVGARIGRGMVMSRRPQDDVELGIGVPAEDELAHCAATFLSPHMGWHFPGSEAAYRRFVTFRDASPDERERWRGQVRSFARKLTVRRDRPIVFKSPCHMGRVALLAEAFPGARFVHIHRHPLEVFRSTCHMERKVTPFFQFQRRDFSSLDEQVLWRYRVLHDAYLEDRRRVPADRLVEIAYDELVRDPVGALGAIYEALGLPEFELVRPEVKRYLAGVRDYRPNEHPPLEPSRQRRVIAEWRPFFDEWGYLVPA